MPPKIDPGKYYDEQCALFSEGSDERSLCEIYVDQCIDQRTNGGKKAGDSVFVLTLTDGGTESGLDFYECVQRAPVSVSRGSGGGGVEPEEAVVRPNPVEHETAVEEPSGAPVKARAPRLTGCQSMLPDPVSSSGVTELFNNGKLCEYQVDGDRYQGMNGVCRDIQALDQPVDARESTQDSLICDELNMTVQKSSKSESKRTGKWEYMSMSGEPMSVLCRGTGCYHLRKAREYNRKRMEELGGSTNGKRQLIEDNLKNMSPVAEPGADKLEKKKREAEEKKAAEARKQAEKKAAEVRKQEKAQRREDASKKDVKIPQPKKGGALEKLVTPAQPGKESVKDVPEDGVGKEAVDKGALAETEKAPEAPSIPSREDVLGSVGVVVNNNIAKLERTLPGIEAKISDGLDIVGYSMEDLRNHVEYHLKQVADKYYEDNKNKDGMTVRRMRLKLSGILKREISGVLKRLYADVEKAITTRDSWKKEADFAKYDFNAYLRKNIDAKWEGTDNNKLIRAHLKVGSPNKKKVKRFKKEYKGKKAEKACSDMHCTVGAGVNVDDVGLGKVQTKPLSYYREQRRRVVAKGADSSEDAGGPQPEMVDPAVSGRQPRKGNCDDMVPYPEFPIDIQDEQNGGESCRYRVSDVWYAGAGKVCKDVANIDLSIDGIRKKYDEQICKSMGAVISGKSKSGTTRVKGYISRGFDSIKIECRGKKACNSLKKAENIVTARNSAMQNRTKDKATTIKSKLSKE